VREVPLYLEVPGMAGKGPDRQNVDILRRLAGLAPLPAGESSVVETEEDPAEVL
jgi:hypothetical protein